jgi:hypothetical protein
VKYQRYRPRRLAPPKPIVRDIWDDEWSLFERRKTPYGFPLLLGRPYPPPPVRGGSGGTRVIMTAPLAAHLHTYARRPHAYPIPVSRAATNRLRTMLGIDYVAWDEARVAWWMDRIDDLANLSIPEFIAKHRKNPWTKRGLLSGPLVWSMRIRLLGRHRRERGWWKAPAVQKLLVSDLSTQAIAERFHIDAAWAGELRRKARVLHRTTRRVRSARGGRRGARGR